MTKIEWRKKRMIKQRRLKNGKVEQITSSKKETFCISKYSSPRDRTNFSSLLLADFKIKCMQLPQQSKDLMKKKRLSICSTRKMIIFKEKRF